jgi:MFS family permease
MSGASEQHGRTGVWGMTGYQWLVLFAAWLGWGFDVFDALLFNFVAARCIPDLLHLQHGTPEAEHATTWWTGVLSSMLLVGWAFGGIAFGRITDRLGRTRTLLLTMLTYSLATAACAFAHNIWLFAFFRLIASFGIGGEWAAGASLVAETVPERRRVQAGALLYSSSPLGFLLAGFVTDKVIHAMSDWGGDPSYVWRAVFLTGLIPAAVAFVIRLWIKEPEAWVSRQASASRARIRDVFTPEYRRATLGGLALAVIALLSWWSVNAFIPRLSAMLVPDDKAGAMFRSVLWFNLGGIAGTFLTVPAARLGRRIMFLLYFAFTACAILVAFALPMPPSWRFMAFGLTGAGTYGLCAAFAFYLPELFPTRLRGTGSGFCYNAGRVIAALGPFMVASAVRAAGSPDDLARTISLSAVFPAIGIVLILFGVGVETRHRALAATEQGALA